MADNLRANVKLDDKQLMELAEFLNGIRAVEPFTKLEVLDMRGGLTEREKRLFATAMLVAMEVAAVRSMAVMQLVQAALASSDVDVAPPPADEKTKWN